ncbi:MAG TPA: hypothetical protein VGK58_02180 [Lacipirellulaceae bacterium]
MKALVFLIVVIALLAFAGWLTFSSGPGRTSVNLETNEIREDTQKIVRSGAKIIDRAGDELQPSEETAQPVGKR